MPSCTTQIAGCERHSLVPLINEINALEGRNYVATECLDQSERSAPMPEVLYLDEVAGAEMVIERKSLIWPRDYARLHSSMHSLADMLTQQLRWLGNRPVTVILELEQVVPKKQLRATVDSIAGSLREAFAKGLETGGASIRQARGRYHWTVRSASDRDFCEEPRSGPVVGWSEPDFDYDNLIDDLARVAVGVEEEIERLLKPLEAKFRQFTSARRIVALEPYGQLSAMPTDWVRERLAAIRIPEVADEVWWCDSFEQDGHLIWAFDRVFERDGSSGKKLTIA